MYIYDGGSFDVIVVGAGHAGCEAALASSRLGCRTLLLTMSWDRVAYMYCNPSLGGPAKGHLVREIDALGGKMALVADRTSLQVRRLNMGKGPAVQALRVQLDKEAYQRTMQNILTNEENLTIRQAVVHSFQMDNKRVSGVITVTGASYKAGAVVLTSGTFLRSRIIMGDVIYAGGPAGEMTTTDLPKQLAEMGVVLGRFKTGTPPRILRRDVNINAFSVQNGDEKIHGFSFLPVPSLFWGKDPQRQLPCYLGYTHERTHEIIRANLHRAPMFTGVVEGIGARYCPSIEDKIVRFSQRSSHQIFLEPEGYGGLEFYVAGLSTSLPEDIQVDVLHSIPGLEKANLLKPGYAIEYDYIKPSQLSLTLEMRAWPGLFCAGQVNGTSGYEEAAGQGLLAGINAALKIKEQPAFVLTRYEAYLGLLVDDLVNREITEPYRLLTSRSEYRLTLRSDNADTRLTEKGRSIGLIDEARWIRFSQKVEAIHHMETLWQNTYLSPADEKVSNILQRVKSSPLRSGIKMTELLKRPEISLKETQELSLHMIDIRAEELNREFSEECNREFSEECNQEFSEECNQENDKETEKELELELELEPSLMMTDYSVGLHIKSTHQRLAREKIHKSEKNKSETSEIDLTKKLPDDEIMEEALIRLKYHGYIQRQNEQIEQYRNMQDKVLPDDIPYEQIYGLANEARTRLAEVRPENIGQATRVSGVNPADISVLLIHLEQRRRQDSTKSRIE